MGHERRRSSRAYAAGDVVGAGTLGAPMRRQTSASGSDGGGWSAYPAGLEYQRTATMRGYEPTVIPGLFQTPDYACYLLLQNSDLKRSPPDTGAAVQARMRRQAVLYEAGKLFRVLIWEGALHAFVGTRDAMAGQLDRLVGLIGMSTVELGIVPLGAPVGITPKHGFWIFDEERVIVETINTEL